MWNVGFAKDLTRRIAQTNNLKDKRTLTKDMTNEEAFPMFQLHLQVGGKHLRVVPIVTKLGILSSIVGGTS
jgi:hypothetical protein